MDQFILLAGNANPDLAEAIAHHLGVALGDCVSQQFPDGEVAVELREPVRQKTCCNPRIVGR